LPGRNLIAAAALLALLAAAAAALTTHGPRPGASDPAPAATGALTDGQRADVRGVVRQYLIENPSVIVEALEILEAHQQAAERDRTQAAIAEHRAALFETPGDPTIGLESASVTIVEFFDYQCPYCKRMTEGLMAVAAQDPDLRVVFKEFPILGEASVVASRAALAAAKQGKYIEFHVTLMAQRGKLSPASIDQAARTAGLDAERLSRDMQAPDIEAAMQANHRLAQAVGITGTPALIIGDQLVPGAVEPARLRSMIARVRAGEG
jgi:protein-disulfide isomerase